MEKSWENFLMTGKVEDYLLYRSSVKETENQKEENGTVDSTHRDGLKHHADF